MIIFKDIFTGDEVASDVYKATFKYENTVMEIDAKTVTIAVDDVVLPGANPSAEEQDDGVDSAAAISGINLALAQKLTQVTPMVKKEYMKYIKDYMKRIENKLEVDNPDRVEVFKKNAALAVKEILTNYKDYDFYQGESMDMDSMMILCNYREEGNPYFIFFLDGLEQE